MENWCCASCGCKQLRSDVRSEPVDISEVLASAASANASAAAASSAQAFVHVKKKKKKKARVGPKRPSTAYLYFNIEMRKKLAGNYVGGNDSGNANQLLSREVGRRWKALNEEGRKPYKDMEAVDLARYQAEGGDDAVRAAKRQAALDDAANSISLAQQAAVGMVSSAEVSAVARNPKSAFSSRGVKQCRCGSTTHLRITHADCPLRGLNKRRAEQRLAGTCGPKRPSSAYNFFVTDMRSARKDEISNLNGFKEQAKRIGVMWKEMPDAQKAVYISQQEADKERYKIEKEQWDSSASEAAAKPVAAAAISTNLDATSII